MPHPNILATRPSNVKANYFWRTRLRYINSNVILNLALYSAQATGRCNDILCHSPSPSQESNHLSRWHHQLEKISALLAFVRGIHRSPVNFPHKGQWRRALMFSLICANKGLGKHSRRRWFETPSRSLWRYCNDFVSFCAAIWRSAEDICVKITITCE